MSTEIDVIDPGCDPHNEAPDAHAQDTSPKVEAAEQARSLGYRIFKALRFWVVLSLIVGAILLTGLSASIVKTGSMRPTYQPGDLVITVNQNMVKPELGSVIVATPFVAGQELPSIAHRIIAVEPDGSFKTKGDYNPEPDAWVDHPADVDKTVIAHVPMHWAMDAVKSPLVVVGGITLFALMLFWPSSKKDDELEELEGGDPAKVSGDHSDDRIVDITDAKQDQVAEA